VEVITIRDGVVTLSEESVIRRVGLEAFKEKLAVGLKVQTPVLPHGTVLYSAKGLKSLVVLEEPPQTRTLSHRNLHRQIKTYEIPLPWVYLVPVFHGSALDDLYVFFSNESVQRGTDKFCYPPLPNTNDDCGICLGDYRYSITRALAHGIADISKYYWASVFNLDLSNLYSTKMPEAIVSATPDGAELFEGWSTISPSRACELRWAPFRTLDEAVNYALA
jgi:hypothetical protein